MDPRTETLLRLTRRHLFGCGFHAAGTAAPGLDDGQTAHGHARSIPATIGRITWHSAPSADRETVDLSIHGRGRRPNSTCSTTSRNWKNYSTKTYRSLFGSDNDLLR